MPTDFKIYCNKCKNENNHKILREIEESWWNDNVGQHKEVWQINKCLGCGSNSFRYSGWCEEDRDPETWDIKEDIEIYPDREFLKIDIKNYYRTPATIRALCKETICAYNKDLFFLCAAWLRAIIEAICTEKNILSGPAKDQKTGELKKRKNLEGRINELAKVGLLTNKQANILHQQRFLGNDALHEFIPSSSETLKIAIEIVDYILYTLYEIVEKEETLEAWRELDKRKGLKHKHYTK